jgi:K+-sensing histidine kinase KdpD
MSNTWVHPSGPIRAPGAAAGPSAEGADTGAVPPVARYLFSLVLVGLAAVLAFVVDHLIVEPDLTLIFVLPVIAAASAFGWGPSLAAALAGALAFDVFFTRPYYSLFIAEPRDLWSAGLFLVIAAIVSSLAARSRRSALQARQADAQALALQNLAQLVIAQRPEWEVVRGAAETLHRAFGAPALIALQSGGELKTVALAGEAQLTDADREAALGALADDFPTRAATYPYGKSTFDFWPAARDGDQAWVIGVAFRERPDRPERLVDIVRAHVAAAVASRPAREAARG